MARIPLGTSGGRMSEVALRLESENRQDERQKRQIHAQQSQFFAQLMQRQAESESRLALDENAQALDAMQSQLREEGLRKHRSFQQATTNVKTGAEYGQQVGWNPSLKKFEAKAVEAGQGFEIAKTKKARAAAEKLSNQIQARQALATATAPELALFDPEYITSVVNSSLTDGQMTDRIQERSKDMIRDLVDNTMRDPQASPEQKASAMSALWESGQEAPHDTAINTLAKKEFEEQRKPGRGEAAAEKAIVVIDKDIRELEKELALPPWKTDPTGKGFMSETERIYYRSSRETLIKKYREQKKKAQAGIADMAKKRTDSAKSYQQIYLELATGRTGEVQARVQEYMGSMQNTVAQIQQAGMAQQPGQQPGPFPQAQQPTTQQGVRMGGQPQQTPTIYPQGQQAGGPVPFGEGRTMEGAVPMPDQFPVDTEGQPSGGQTLIGQPLEPYDFGGGAPEQGGTVVPTAEDVNAKLASASPEVKDKALALAEKADKAWKRGDKQTYRALTAELVDLLK